MVRKVHLAVPHREERVVRELAVLQEENRELAAMIAQIEDLLQKQKDDPDDVTKDMVFDAWEELKWMCDINQSVIAELNAIVLSSVAQIVLEPQARAFRMLSTLIARTTTRRI